ncbi:Glutamine--tRNA ligase [compost metagenome]
MSGRKVKGTVHWVSASHAVPAEVNLYEKLLKVGEGPKNESEAWEGVLNPDSVRTLNHCLVEPYVLEALALERFQFIRHGYFTADNKHCSTEHLVFNRIVPLKDGWKGKK